MFGFPNSRSEHKTAGLEAIEPKISGVLFHLLKLYIMIAYSSWFSPKRTSKFHLKSVYLNQKFPHIDLNNVQVPFTKRESEVLIDEVLLMTISFNSMLSHFLFSMFYVYFKENVGFFFFF